MVSKQLTNKSAAKTDIVHTPKPNIFVSNKYSRRERTDSNHSAYSSFHKLPVHVSIQFVAASFHSHFSKTKFP
jgi:hypothetical protein